VRRAIDPLVPDASATGRMTAEIAKIGPAKTSQQLEINDDARLRASDLNLKIFGFFL
jgi:hypothetical protein